MIVNLMRARQMFSLTLPNKVKGRYWLTDLDESGKRRRLVDIEAVDGVWVLKGNRKVRIYGANDCETPSAVLNDSIFLRLGVEGSDEQVVLFTEPVDPTRQTLTKISVTEAAVFSVGRTAANQFAFDNRYVSGTHAKLVYDGEEWSVSDEGSRNGTYVNGLRAGNQKLQPGDCIYIMGLKIVVGKGFLAVNNPDCRLTIRSDALQVYGGQKRDPAAKRPELPEKQYFSRSPRFHREICHEEITIDPPPPPQKNGHGAAGTDARSVAHNGDDLGRHRRAGRGEYHGKRRTDHAGAADGDHVGQHAARHDSVAAADEKI